MQNHSLAEVYLAAHVLGIMVDLPGCLVASSTCIAAAPFTILLTWRCC